MLSNLETSDLSVPRNRKNPRHALRTYLVNELAKGTLKPGEALLPERRLAEILETSRTTVRQTLGELENEGLIVRIQGKGTFITEHATVGTANRTDAFAIVVLDVVSGYYRSLLSGFEQACSAVGRHAVVCDSGNSVDRQGNHMMRLLAHRVSGVVLNATASVATPSYQVQLLQDAGIPVVLLHRAVPEVAAPLLEMPAAETGRQAARLLLEAGHRQVAFFDSYRADLSLTTESSFRDALTEAGFPLHQDYVVYGKQEMWDNATSLEQYEQVVAQRLRQLLSRRDRLTAIFANGDTIAEHIYLATQRLGIRVPDELSLLCFGGGHREGAILRRLAAITIDEIGAGEKAVELLQEMRTGKRQIRNSEAFQLSLTVCPGETLGPPHTSV